MNADISASSTPRVSVVLPTRNRAALLRESVQSLRAQTFQDWELVIVDDCSTDETPSVVQELEKTDPRIRGVRNAVNQKLPGSLNIGFAQARGELLTWTSDDNNYLPGALAVMVERLDARPEVDLVYTDMNLIDAEGAHLSVLVRPEPDEIAFRNVVTGAMLYRRRVMDSIGQYDTSLFLLEDYDYWLRAAQKFRLERIPGVHYDWRTHGDTLTSLRQDEIRQRREIVMRRHLPKLGWCSRQSRARGWLKTADLAWRRRAPLRSAADFLHAAVLDPVQCARHLVWKLRQGTEKS